MSFIESVKFIEEKVYKIIKENVEKIKNGYLVEDYEIKNNNFYSCSKITCYNGFKGSIWDIEEPLNRDLQEYKKSIQRNGFIINNIQFSINIDKINFNNLQIKDIEVILIKKN